jgi:ATP-dependent Clp protease ATP-binding subunit ClpA
MFEKFTREARDVVEGAQSVARTHASRSIDSRHLLLALIQRDTSAAGCLGSVGLDPAGLAAALSADLRSGGLDAEALASVGIDLDAVRDRADAVFGEGALDRGRRPPVKGHIPFAPDAKKVLELALREAIRLRTNRIDDRMLLLGLLRGTGSPAEQVLSRALTEAGAGAAALRSVLEEPQARAS